MTSSTRASDDVITHQMLFLLGSKLSKQIREQIVKYQLIEIVSCFLDSPVWNLTGYKKPLISQQIHSPAFISTNYNYFSSILTEHHDLRVQRLYQELFAETQFAPASTERLQRDAGSRYPARQPHLRYMWEDVFIDLESTASCSESSLIPRR